MTRPIFLALLLSAAALPAAPVPKEAKADFNFEGLWFVESIVSNGTPIVADDPEYWTIDSKSVVMMHAGTVPPPGKTGHLQLTFDTAGRTLEYRLIHGAGARCFGRYEVSGRTLTVAIDLNGGRPASVDTGSGIYVWKLKRVAAEAAK
jgi:hypothetical protein